MNSNRKTAIIAGVLFLIVLVSSMLSGVFLGSTTDPNYLTAVAANENQVLIGMLIQLIWALAVVGIPVMLFPILKKQNERLALGYVGARIFEGFFDAVMAISMLLLLTLSQEFVKAGAPDASYFQILGELLLAVRYWAYNVLWPIMLGLGGLIFYYLFYKSKLIPRWLSVWGFIGALLFPVAWLSLFGSTISGPFLLPLVVNEMVLAVWLIVKGFNSSAINSLSA